MKLPFFKTKEEKAFEEHQKKVAQASNTIDAVRMNVTDANVRLELNKVYRLMKVLETNSLKLPEKDQVEFFNYINQTIVDIQGDLAVGKNADALGKVMGLAMYAGMNFAQNHIIFSQEDAKAIAVTVALDGAIDSVSERIRANLEAQSALNEECKKLLAYMETCDDIEFRMSENEYKNKKAKLRILEMDQQQLDVHYGDLINQREKNEKYKEYKLSIERMKELLERKSYTFEDLTRVAEEYQAMLEEKKNRDREETNIFNRVPLATKEQEEDPALLAIKRARAGGTTKTETKGSDIDRDNKLFGLKNENH